MMEKVAMCGGRRKVAEKVSEPFLTTGFICLSISVNLWFFLVRSSIYTTNGWIPEITTSLS